MQLMEADSQRNEPSAKPVPTDSTQRRDQMTTNPMSAPNAPQSSKPVVTALVALAACIATLSMAAPVFGQW